jgi:hypothetical protein
VIKLEEENIIKHVSLSSGRVYNVDLLNRTCDCPDYKIRQAKIKGFCKHLKIEIEKRTNNEKIDYVKEIEDNPDSVSFVEKYGEKVLEMLKIQGICFEKNGRLEVLK